MFVRYGLPAAVQWPFGGLAVGLELAVGGMGGGVGGSVWVLNWVYFTDRDGPLLFGRRQVGQFPKNKNSCTAKTAGKKNRARRAMGKKIKQVPGPGCLKDG